jgi:hypothetical protein
MSKQHRTVSLSLSGAFGKNQLTAFLIWLSLTDGYMFLAPKEMIVLL